MPHRPSCCSCRHCTPPRVAEMGWCQLRQLAIHPELATELWCPHWTARPPRLPQTTAAVKDLDEGLEAANLQLSLTPLMQTA